METAYWCITIGIAFIAGIGTGIVIIKDDKSDYYGDI